jgi:hypothetical protein
VIGTSGNDLILGKGGTGLQTLEGDVRIGAPGADNVVSGCEKTYN